MRGYDGLVGREHALAAGHAVMGEALAGRGQLLLVTGEPGIGKTALAGRLLREIPGARARTAWASCRQGEGTPAYWPWVQVLRAVSRSWTEGGPAVALGDAASLLPEQAVARADDGGTDRAGAAEAARFRLFDALAHTLVQAEAESPLVVVLDDLHWSDEPSLLALQFIADQIRTNPVLLLGTYRETEAGATLFDLARSASVLQLTGLAEGDVASLMEGIAGSPPAPAEARQVWRRTGATRSSFARWPACSIRRPPHRRGACPSPYGRRCGAGSRCCRGAAPRCWPRPRSSGASFPSTSSPGRCGRGPTS